MPRHLTIASHGDRTAARVALTFDDGPNPHATPQILDVLRRARCAASFFVIGRWAAQHPDLVRRIVAEGHSIGGHTYTHGGDWNSDTCADFIRGNRVVAEITGMPVRFVRVPGFQYDAPDYHGSRAHELLQPELQQQIATRDLVVVDCDVETADWDYAKSPDDILRTVSGQVQNGSIVDMHDGSHRRVDLRTRAARTVAALPAIIETVRAQGRDLVNLEDMRLHLTTRPVAP